MAINFDAGKRIFTLHTRHTTYQMMADSYGNLLHLYYGAKCAGTMEYAISPQVRGFSGNPYEAGMDRSYSLDTLPQEFPALGTGDFRAVALNIENADGSECCRLSYVRHEIRPGKYHLDGLPAVWAGQEEAQTLEIVLEDAVSGIQVSLFYGVLEACDIITRSAVIRNMGHGSSAEGWENAASEKEGRGDAVFIKKAAAACLDFVHGEYDLMTFYGKHAMERVAERTRVSHGTRRIGSRRGTSSHQHNPAVILMEPDATEDAGRCYGAMLVYSGSFLCEVEKDQFDQTRMILGLSDELFSYPLSPGEEFVVPEVVLSYSAQGLGTLSRQFHRCVRDHICRGNYEHAARPVLINSWEACYFEFDHHKILELAGEAADLGMDMVVMDDGWFGHRDDDNSSLGDWYVNESKLGCTLAELVDAVHKLGVRFGIWIEPEMVSEDSDLYRSHPDWAVQIPGRKPIRSRNQLVLDFSRQEVRDAVFAQICAILDQAEIEYVKWDMNRSLDDVYAGNLSYDYMIGVYDFLDRLTGRYPDLLIEGCSGGGGRFDAGMMYYTPQIWCSDNTDAVDRTKIQYGSSFFYPLSVMGAHVSAVPNHQTGRVTPLSTRGITAMSGAFGYEMNPARLDEEEKALIREQIRTYKHCQKLISQGDYYRLSNPFREEYAAWMTVSEDRSQALVSVVRLRAQGGQNVTYVRLKGLDADAWYREETSGQSYSGAALQELGVVLEMPHTEYEAYQFILHRIEPEKCR